MLRILTGVARGALWGKEAGYPDVLNTPLYFVSVPQKRGASPGGTFNNVGSTSLSSAIPPDPCPPQKMPGCASGCVTVPLLLANAAYDISKIVGSFLS